MHCRLVEAVGGVVTVLGQVDEILALDDAVDARLCLAGCGLVLMAFPVAAAVLPDALNRGLTRVALPAFQLA